MSQHLGKFEGTHGIVRTGLHCALVAALVLVLSACASHHSYYTPALEEGAVGYTESRLERARYRVVYRGDTGATAQEVQDFALLRAAELTVAQNYDWFEVAQRTTTPEPELANQAGATVQISTGTTRQTRCGIIGCTTTETATAPAFPQSEVEFGQQDSRFIASLEVLMGEGQHDRSVDIYDARELIAALRASF